ncbi:hypothetical protein HD553DRAFT_325797 [Filobasidium floriforme]|uniref:uncharacterized protein n=1 Tax=Filobasidium floriforme TaxID=5210 RepID=UPI001E8CC341|nr:uncharacterized protein HD553DRAFT_325797 [Filobasidium floriforme]KAH8080825.1 hypothetical protein HD553DRAFT_325797 [Filobasidium floriforme]
MPRVKRPDPVRLWDHDLKCTNRRTDPAPPFPPQVPHKLVDDLLYRLKRITVGYLQQKELDTITKEINTRYRDEMKQMQFRDWNQTIDKISAELCEKDGWGSRMVKVSVEQWEVKVLGEIDWDEIEQQHGPSTSTWCFWLSESLVPALQPDIGAGSQLDSSQEVASLKTENEQLRELLSQMLERTKSLETELHSTRTTLAKISTLCSTSCAYCIAIPVMFDYGRSVKMRYNGTLPGRPANQSEFPQTLAEDFLKALRKDDNRYLHALDIYKLGLEVSMQYRTAQEAEASSSEIRTTNRITAILYQVGDSGPLMFKVIVNQWEKNIIEKMNKDTLDQLDIAHANGYGPSDCIWWFWVSAKLQPADPVGLEMNPVMRMMPPDYNSGSLTGSFTETIPPSMRDTSYSTRYGGTSKQSSRRTNPSVGSDGIPSKRNKRFGDIIGGVQIGGMSGQIHPQEEAGTVNSDSDSDANVFTPKSDRSQYGASSIQTGSDWHGPVTINSGNHQIGPTSENHSGIRRFSFRD